MCSTEIEQRHREIIENRLTNSKKNRTLATVFATVAVDAAVAVQAAVFVVENAHARRSPQEPRGLLIVPCLSLGGYNFSKQFLEPLFWSTGLNSDSEMVPKWDPNGIIFRPFSENVNTLTSETPHTV